jgi:tetratricopeptide (TPR) repeat protein
MSGFLESLGRIPAASPSPCPARKSVIPVRWWFGLPALGVSMFAVCLIPARSPARADSERPPLGSTSRSHADTESLLVDYFRVYLSDRDLDAFRNRVAGRYSEEALRSILADSPIVTARRAAVISLGLLGSYRQSNAALGRALRDSDAAVRTLAEDALWSVWFRADSPENNRALQEVMQLAGRGQLDRAEVLASRLIAVAPNFAEAYNQRAIIYFRQGRFADSAADCQNVLTRNPFHFGAMSGMAHCQLQLNRPAEALKTLRRALKLQPYSDGLRENVRLVEARLEPGRLP